MKESKRAIMTLTESMYGEASVVSLGWDGAQTKYSKIIANDLYSDCVKDICITTSDTLSWITFPYAVFQWRKLMNIQRFCILMWLVFDFKMFLVSKLYHDIIVIIVISYSFHPILWSGLMQLACNCWAVTVLKDHRLSIIVDYNQMF